MLLSPSSPKPMAENCTGKKSDLWLKLVLENVLTPSIGCLGIFGNCVAIDTLRHPPAEVFIPPPHPPSSTSAYLFIYCDPLQL